MNTENLETEENEELLNTDEFAEADQDNTELDEVERLRQEVGEWKELAQRKAAEVDNIRRRSQQRELEIIGFAAENTISKLLTILDDLAAAHDAAQRSEDIAALRKGLEMIFTKTSKLFEEAGVQVLEAQPGEPFNVDVHEALMHQASEHPEGSVVMQIQRGYKLRDKVLKHAKVITSAGNA